MTAPAHRSLLETLQRIIERTYAMDTGIRDVGRFVLGDDGYRRLVSGRTIRQTVGSGAAHAGPAPRLLLRGGEEGGRLRAAIYYPDALIRSLEAAPPTLGLGEENIDAFAAFVEELDHLLCVADRARAGRAFSLLELELHANVTKYLLGALFLARRQDDRPLGEGQRVWLRYHLFEKRRFVDEDRSVRSRYRDAAHYARKFLRHVESLAAEDRLAELRRFHARSHPRTLVGTG